MCTFAVMKYNVKFDENNLLELDLQAPFQGTVAGENMSLDVHDNGDGRMHIIFKNKSYNAEILSVEGKAYRVKIGANIYELNLEDEHDMLLRNLGMEDVGSAKAKNLKAPMPGMVLDVLIEAGQQVSKNDPLLILEAMKMENIIKAPADGLVSKVTISTGQAVEKNELLIEFD
jgi:biotin carboxyl carrier protein